MPFLKNVIIKVATRANALRQRSETVFKRRIPDSRNPRECAEAKNAYRRSLLFDARRNPRECAEAKHAPSFTSSISNCRNPRECAEAKIELRANNSASSVATRANALRQSRAIVVPEPETPKA